MSFPAVFAWGYCKMQRFYNNQSADDQTFQFVKTQYKIQSSLLPAGLTCNVMMYTICTCFFLYENCLKFSESQTLFVPVCTAEQTGQ